MTPRLTSKFLVSALVRRVEIEGGHGAILARGDAEAGAILLLCAERGVPQKLRERTLDFDRGYVWTACGPENIDDSEALAAYIDRRRSRDPDLWLVELDIAHAERFAAETIAQG